MILQRTIDTYCGMYDFAVTGGAIGSYDLQVPIPQNSVIINFFAVAIIAPLSAGAATISFDAIDNSVSPVVVGVGGLMPARAKTAFPVRLAVWGMSGGIGEFDAAYSTLNTLTPYGKILVTGQVQHTFSVGMSIGTAVLTAGKILFGCQCVTYDLPA